MYDPSIHTTDHPNLINVALWYIPFVWLGILRSACMSIF